MFARRVFCGNAIPQRLYGSLNISTRSQAQRLVPTTAPLLSSIHIANGAIIPISRSLEVAAKSATENLDLDSAALRVMLETLSLSFGQLQSFELQTVIRLSPIF